MLKIIKKKDYDNLVKDNEYFKNELTIARAQIAKLEEALETEMKNKKIIEDKFKNLAENKKSAILKAKKKWLYGEQE